MSNFEAGQVVRYVGKSGTREWDGKTMWYIKNDGNREESFMKYDEMEKLVRDNGYTRTVIRPATPAAPVAEAIYVRPGSVESSQWRIADGEVSFRGKPSELWGTSFCRPHDIEKEVREGSMVPLTPAPAQPASTGGEAKSEACNCGERPNDDPACMCGVPIDAHCPVHCTGEPYALFPPSVHKSPPVHASVNADPDYAPPVTELERLMTREELAYTRRRAREREAKSAQAFARQAALESMAEYEGDISLGIYGGHDTSDYLRLCRTGGG